MSFTDAGEQPQSFLPLIGVVASWHARPLCAQHVDEIFAHLFFRREKLPPLAPSGMRRRHSMLPTRNFAQYGPPAAVRRCLRAGLPVPHKSLPGQQQEASQVTTPNLGTIYTVIWNAIVAHHGSLDPVVRDGDDGLM
jgi:hypothetical protein